MAYEAGIAVGSAEVPAEEKNEKAHPMSLRACVCVCVDLCLQQNFQQ